MKKYKHFVIGFLVGAILFSIAPVSAAIEEFLCYKADYKVMINGSEYISKDLPILNYKGNTYAPFRPILEKAGLSVNWNAELGQAEVTLNPLSAQTIEKNAATMPTTIQYDPVTGLPIGAEYVDMGMNAFNNYSYDKGIKYNGKLYVTRTYLFRKYNISYKSTIDPNSIYEKDGIQVSINVRDKSKFFHVGNVAYYDLEQFKILTGE